MAEKTWRARIGDMVSRADFDAALNWCTVQISWGRLLSALYSTDGFDSVYDEE